MTTLPPTSPSVPYSQVCSELGTGDLLFLHGTSPAAVMVERLEERANLPPYSHVGMVVKDGDNLYLWDAPGGGDCFCDPYVSNPDNRLNGNDPVHGGCRVSVLEKVLPYYVTLVDPVGFWLRRLTSGVSQEQVAALRRFINRVDGLPFPPGPEAVGLVLNFAAAKKKCSLFYGTYFCSQLVAESYMHMGLLEMECLPPNGYSPAAFGMNEPNQLRLVSRATLGDVVFVTWDSPTGRGKPCPPEAAPAEGAPGFWTFTKPVA
jgi:hypothetical protein